MDGFDYSAWQGDIDWNQIKKDGKVKFAFGKATEGIDSVDSNFVKNHDAAKAAGIPVGAYHFFHFGQDPVEQAKHFLSTIAGREGQLLPMVDVESGGQDGVTDLATLISALSAFIVEVEKTLHGKKCIIYCDYGDWNGFMQGTDAFSGHPFFVAEYNNDKEPTLPSGFKKFDLWQHADNEQIDGIHGNVDADSLNGDSLALISR